MAQPQDSGSQGQLQVKFVTRHPEISIPSAPILVPSNLKRFGLSQVVNHLLDKPENIPFDFLIDGAFLRSTLEAYIADKGLSSESVITLEYVRATEPPTHRASFEHDDWVSSVSTNLDDPNAPLILSGAYDGVARIWNMSGQILADAPGHHSAIKAVSWLDGQNFVTAGMDRSLRIWSYENSSAVDMGNIECSAEYIGHTSTVEALAVNSASRQVLSASTDGTVGIWGTRIDESPATTAKTVPQRSRKRRRTGPNRDVPIRGPLVLLGGHTAAASAVGFAPSDHTVAYSTSWDHTIRTWDLSTFVLVDTRTTQDSILSLCFLPELHLIACGSSARYITLHDPRASAGGVSAATLRGHTNSVVALSPSPHSDWQMASASHDGTVAIWDIRASHSGKLFTIESDSGQRKKVFDVDWSSAGLISAGEGKKIQTMTFNKQEESNT